MYSPGKRHGPFSGVVLPTEGVADVPLSSFSPLLKPFSSYASRSKDGTEPDADVAATIALGLLGLQHRCGQDAWLETERSPFV